MITRTSLPTLLLSTTLTLPLASVVSAQTIRIDEAQLVSKSAECQTLGRDVATVTTLPSDVTAETIAAAINDDDSVLCADLQTRVVTDTADTTLTGQVDLSQSATIEGQARVTIPEPNVDVQVPAPNVRVVRQAPQVTVSEPASEIQVMQEQPTIDVEIPQIVVRVNIPAPTLYVLAADPQVSVTEADPQVEVEQGQPVVSVTQGKPQLDIDLGIDPNAPATDANTANQNVTADNTAQQVDGNVQAIATQPQVEIVQAEGGPQLSYDRQDPTVTYENLEPQVRVMMAEQPAIEIQQVGEMTIVVETAEEREQRIAAKPK